MATVEELPKEQEVVFQRWHLTARINMWFTYAQIVFTMIAHVAFEMGHSEMTIGLAPWCFCESVSALPLLVERPSM